MVLSRLFVEVDNEAGSLSVITSFEIRQKPKKSEANFAS